MIIYLWGLKLNVCKAERLLHSTCHIRVYYSDVVVIYFNYHFFRPLAIMWRANSNRTSSRRWYQAAIAMLQANNDGGLGQRAYNEKWPDLGSCWRRKQWNLLMNWVWHWRRNWINYHRKSKNTQDWGGHSSSPCIIFLLSRRICSVDCWMRNSTWEDMDGQSFTHIPGTILKGLGILLPFFRLKKKSWNETILKGLI